MRTSKVMLGVALAGFFAYLAFKNFQVGDLSKFTEMQPGWIIAGMVVLAVGYAARVWRWHIILRDHQPRLQWSACVGPFLASFALNNVLPFRAGDVARSFSFERQLGVSPAKVLSSLLVERIFDLCAILLVLGLAVLVAAPQALPGIVTLGAGIAAVAALCALVFLFLLTPASSAVVAWLIAFLPERSPLRSRTDKWRIDFFAVLVSSRSLSRFFILAALSVLGWLFEGGVFYCVARALAEAPGATAWIAMAMGSLATLIPSTPGHIGTFDYFVIQGVLLSGMATSTAQVFAVSVHLLLWLPITVAGLSWLFLYSHRMLAARRLTLAAEPPGKS